MTTAPKPIYFIKMSEALRRAGRTRYWVYEAIKDGRFPKPVKDETNQLLFVEAEVDAWAEALVASRDREAVG